MGKRKRPLSKKTSGPVHFVTFFSPGTFVSEYTTKPIKSRNTKLAAQMAREIKERHGATPYGFRFETRIKFIAARITAESPSVKTSKMFYLGGCVRSSAKVLAGKHPTEKILRENVKSNKYPAIIVNRNSYEIACPFLKGDVLLDHEGNRIFKLPFPKGKSHHEIKV